MTYWIRPDETHCCRRCGQEITLKETCVVGPGDDGQWHPDDTPTMRVTLECSPSCHQMGFPLGPLRDPDGTAISKRDVPDGWIPESFVKAIST